jgi:integrase
MNRTRRRSSGSAWIEPKHGVPCRVCWRRNGQRQKPSAWFDRRADALVVRDALRERLRCEAPLLAAGQALPLTDVRDRWLAARQAEGKMSSGTATAARLDIDRILRDTDWKTVHDITPQQLKDWRIANPKAARGTPIRYLRAMLRWSILGDTLAQPVASGLDLSCPQTEVANRPRPSDEALQIILERAQAIGHFPLVHCLMAYPWRPSSFCRLRISDLDLADPHNATALLRRTKNRKDVRGLLTPETVEVLTAHVAGRHPDDHVFLRTNGTPWPLDKCDRSNALSKWFRAKLTFDMPSRAYDLKRTGITDLVKASGGDLDAVAKLAGISKQMVVRYLQSNEEGRREVLARFTAMRAQGAVRGQLARHRVKLGDIPKPLSADFSVNYASVETGDTTQTR